MHNFYIHDAQGRHGCCIHNAQGLIKHDSVVEGRTATIAAAATAADNRDDVYDGDVSLFFL